MRILVIHNQLWAHYKSKLFFEISNRIKETYPGSDFFVVQIALFESSRSSMQDEEAYPYSYPYVVLFNRSLNSIGFREKFLALKKEFDTYKPTVLNVTGYSDWAQILLMMYARMKGVKIVLSSESSSADNSRVKVKEKLKSWIIGQADSFFCFGKTSADYLLGLGAKPAQIAVDNAAVIDEEIIRANYDKAVQQKNKGRDNVLPAHNFVFVGRLAPEKNLRMLIQTFISLKKEEPDATSWGLLFVGDGPLRTDLETLAKASSFEKQIHFAGGRAWHKVPEWLAKSDVLLLPSISEPWGLVVNEAMVCAMPVIVSKNCGCTDDLLKNEKNGFTFNPLNESELKEAMLFFIKNPDKIIPMGKESELLIKRFASKHVAAEMAASYNSLSA